MTEPKSEAESDRREQYHAVDPSDLEVGDEVIVEDIPHGAHTAGAVEGITVEAGRYGVDVHDDDLDRTVRVWEESGRAWTRVETDA